MWKIINSQCFTLDNYKCIEGYSIEYYTQGDIHSKEYISQIWIPVKKTNA